MQGQLSNKQREIDDLKNEVISEKKNMQTKLEDLKNKYDKTMDELTQSKIENEREKALKDQRLQFQESRLKEYHDQIQQTVDRYEERLK